MARYRDGERLAEQRPPQCAAANDGFGGVVDVGWAIREAGAERGGAASHMEHARGHPGLLVVGCNESPARSSTTQACQVSHMEHATPPREHNVGGGGASHVVPYVTPGRSEGRSSMVAAARRTNARLAMDFTNAASQLLLPGNSSQGRLNDEGSAIVSVEVNPLAASSTASWGDDPALRGKYRCCPRCCVLTAREFDACHRCHASFESR